MCLDDIAKIHHSRYSHSDSSCFAIILKNLCFYGIDGHAQLKCPSALICNPPLLSCQAVWAFGAVGPFAILRAVVKHDAKVLASLPGPPVAPGNGRQ